MTTANGVRRRGRSIQKRQAILEAARALFITDGYDHTSVDAIAARAEVSKRTVYDHFGDKEGILAAVLENVTEKLTITIRAALEQELVAGCDLRAGLLAFARRIATEAFPSSDYADYRNLTARRLPSQRNPRSVSNTPGDLFAQRMQTFADDGAINTTNPRRAAQHFVALTFQLALDTLDPTATSAWYAVDEILVDGVNAFVRSYT